jgi:hypothetical protein
VFSLWKVNLLARSPRLINPCSYLISAAIMFGVSRLVSSAVSRAWPALGAPRFMSFMGMGGINGARLSNAGLLSRQGGLPWSGVTCTGGQQLQSQGVNCQQFTQVRLMNRNARRPKRANHGKRPVSHARKREKMKSLKSRLYREKVFGFW